MSRLHTVQTLPEQAVHDLTPSEIDQTIDILIRRIVGCGCTCSEDTLQIVRWRRRKAELLLTLPPPRSGE